ncbi:MAG: DNA recombination protein RmuC [Hydrotalea sp.]|nr:DNA recombination protein RmuC [Hydrotalea sp.]
MNDIFPVLIFVAGLLCGLLAGWFIRKSTHQQEVSSNFVDELRNQFKSIAYDILDDQRQKNIDSIGTIINPFRENITEFRGQIEKISRDASLERNILQEQIRQISQDASNLTRALTSSGKTSGNWGELVLARLLENSGLQEGVGYLSQPSYNLSGKQFRPDVVLLLPDKKHLIIDAKLSLADYERFVNGGDEVEKQSSLLRHVAAVRKHIKDLSEKNYHQIPELNSLDFVVMFVPIEPAYIAAIEQDVNLWEEAWRRNILLASPSSFIFVLRTIATLWQQEAQNKNAKEIARQAGSLYDKFVGFVEDLQAVGSNLDRAKDSYDQSLKKLSTGKGSLTSQSEKLKKMGANASKNIPDNLLPEE